MNFSKNPYVYYFLALIMGIFLCDLIFIPIPYILILLGLLIVLLGFIVNKADYKGIFSILTLVSWSLLGMVVVELNNSLLDDHYINYKENGKAQVLTVVLKEHNNSTKNFRKYTAEVTSIIYKNKQFQTKGSIMLFVDKQKYNSVLTLGNEYILKLTITDPTGALNPHQFDYSNYLKRNYILQTGRVDEIISESPHASLIYSIKNFNQYLVKKIESSTLGEDSKEFLKAYLLGDRSEMKKESIDVYSKSGIMHLIAISGMHIALLFGIIFNLLTLMMKSGNRKTIIIISLLFVWFFGCLVGLTSSVFRSCLMITIYYCFELLKRTGSIYHSMSLSAFIILLCDPNEIYSMGFQLSYIAVFFIVWLSPILIYHMKSKNKKINKWIVNPLAVTLAAQIGTLPFVLFYFHQFSLLSIPINILIIPYTFIITYSSIVELFLVFLPWEYQEYFSFIYDFLVKLLVDSTYYISSVEPLMLKNIPLNLWELFFVSFSLIFLKNYLSGLKLNHLIPPLLCIVLFQLSILYNDYHLSGEKNFIVFNHKNSLLGFRDGKKLLVVGDSTENWELVKRYIIDPYSIGERINEIQIRPYKEDKIYKWEGKKIQILNKSSKNCKDSVDYLIVNNPLIECEIVSDGTIIITGNNNKHRRYNNKSSKCWYTSRQGAFISCL
ncbi:ComEC/Rec2 family competence protein [Apibacter mensalis]|uniref:ComEC/Rec2 family competence protein n=1 Tax=Apibacter mensalis TaxID=1586267 RepID=UPI0026F0AB42|nr:ComEC/Rec2 family competence protein [Apibacter mensalis]